VSVPSSPQYERADALGLLPERWRLVPLKRIIEGMESGTSVNAVDVPAADGEAGVLKTSCVYKGVFDPGENKRVTEEDRERVSCPVRAGTVIVSRMNTPDLIGAAGVVTESSNHLFLPDRLWQVSFSGVQPEFVHFWTLTPHYRGQIQAACSGTSASMKNIGQDQFGAFSIPVPPEEDQSLICSFLIDETGKIDRLIAHQRRLIDLLNEKRQAAISHAVTKGLNPTAPVKPSGVEWLGDVPETWEIRRLGELFGEIAQAGSEDLPILSVSIHHGVSDDEMDESELDRKVTRSEDRSKYKQVVPNDLVYNMMRAWQGGFGTVRVKGMVSPAYVVARPRRRFDTKYIESVLRTPQAIEEMRRHSRGVTDFRLRLYWDEFKTIRVPLPPDAELRAIGAEIAALEDRFTELISTTEQAIELLMERRSALITAAVTGQIDVRGHAAAEVA
jgi:type I restriction enzyme S subunit